MRWERYIGSRDSSRHWEGKHDTEGLVNTRVTGAASHANPSWFSFATVNLLLENYLSSDEQVSFWSCLTLSPLN